LEEFINRHANARGSVMDGHPGTIPTSRVDVLERFPHISAVQEEQIRRHADAELLVNKMDISRIAAKDDGLVFITR
tara:strand:+ start:237 stop:464 length:228 start_codon:yes stop_codon:yes gene_type:complete